MQVWGAINWDWSLDGWIVLAGILCAVSASLPGNFLLLRRMSMLGDAISHAVLPGLVVAFLISESRSSLPMFLGAVIVGVLTAFFTEWIRNFGEVDEGASMGVVFTTMFALGLVMIVQAADKVDLDPGCVLYGAIEETGSDMLSVAGMVIPRVVLVLSTVLVVNLLFVVIFYKELQICSFDPALATTSGIHAGLMHYLLMILVAVTAVASFESVGNILVVAMFVVPPAAARLLTDRLSLMIVLSAVLASLSAVLGHLSAIVVPGWFGFRSASTSGMMALTAGLLFSLCALFAPQQGIIVRWVRSRMLSYRILSEDLIALLYRMEEKQPQTPRTAAVLRDALLATRFSTSLVLSMHRLQGHVDRQAQQHTLTDSGHRLGAALVRSHRLWENYLVTEAGVSMDRIHEQAEKLEHFTGRELRDRLDQQTQATELDPHGSRIPSED